MSFVRQVVSPERDSHNTGELLSLYAQDDRQRTQVRVSSLLEAEENLTLPPVAKLPLPCRRIECELGEGLTKGLSR
jgi:hypothetical protein